MTMEHEIENVRIINHDEDFVGSVMVGDGKILKVEKKNFLQEGEKRKILMPGIIDPHVHFRTPGLEHKEDFTSGSRAALSGGVTAVFDMPNTKPPTFTVELLKEKRKIVGAISLVHWGLYFGGGSNAEEIQNVKNIPGVKLYVNNTTGNLKNTDQNTWRTIFNAAKKVSLHAEGEAFETVVKVWEEEHCPCELHLCHTSLKSEVELLRLLKKDTATAPLISAEVCPHHLLLIREDLSRYPLATMKPPLSSSEDREALWEGIMDGTIDILATDHAPHTLAEKNALTPAYGIPGVETLFPLMFTEFVKREISLSKFVAMTSWKTRDIFHIQNQKGKIAEGYDADLILVDPETEWKIDASKFQSKVKWSPFDGWRVKGKIEKTFLGGKVVCEDGKITDEEVRGQELIFEK